MVLRKPYAFLIRHFKLIHLLLCIPLIYLVIRTGAIASFLNDYVASNYYTNVTNIPGTYINYFMYLAIVMVILLVLAVYFLMRQKEKDTKFYMFLILYYVILFVLISFCHGILDAVETASIEAQSVRMYRDIAWIIYIPQFFFIGYTALRGIGFDLKKFNFEEDVKELEITDIDNEEFELVFGKDAYKYKRTIRRFFREFRYYVLENKFTFTILSIVIVIGIGTLLYINFGVLHKTYRQTQRISHNNLLVTVTDSVLSNMDLGGNIIDKDKYYLALGLRIKNNGKTSTTFDYENFKINVANYLISATLDRTSYFADFGIPFSRDTLIEAGTENVYALTYEIPSELIHRPLTLKILDSLTYEIGSVTPIYKTVNLRYETVLENKEIKSIPLGRILEMSGSRVGMTQIELNEFSIQKSYEYNYQSCSGEYCQDLKNKVVSQSKNTLLILDRNFSIDTYTDYYHSRKGAGSFVADFFKIRYEVNDKRRVSTVVDVTPKVLNDTWVFEVPEDVSFANKVELLVTLRGEIYSLQIK